MDSITHFTTLLQTSTDDFIWAARQIPEEQLYNVSPHRPDSWSVARTVLHLQFQEEKVVLPNMRLWLPERDQYMLEDDSLIQRYMAFETLVQDEEARWLQHPLAEDLLALFRKNRDIQIALLTALPTSAWEEKHPTVWGEVSLRWSVTKTYQHTVEHVNEVLKPALYWAGLRA